MTTVWDEALAEAYAAAPPEVIVLNAVEIWHRAFTQPARIVRWPVTDNEPQKFNLLHEPDAPYNPGAVVEYIGLPFEATLPESSKETPGQFIFRMDHIGSLLDADLEAAALEGGTIRAVFRQYIKEQELQGPNAVWDGISIGSPMESAGTIEATGTVMNWLLKPYGRIYAPEDYPALVKGR